MTHSFYTVGFFNQDNRFEVSRYFETIRAAKKWLKWLETQKFVREVCLYRGQPGEERLI